MVKKAFILVVIIAVFMLTLSGCDKEYITSSGIRYIEKEDYIIVNGIVKKSEVQEVSIVIPEVINGKPVTKISDEYLVKGRTDKYLPAIVTNVESIVIPKSVTYINPQFFDDNTTLKEIIVEEDNNNYSSSDGILFNKDKTSLIRCPQGKEGEYIIPNSVTSIEPLAFFSCEKITNITIPNGVSTIKDKTFLNCKGLISINIPNSVTSIDNSAFSNCESLVSIVIPSSVKTIGQGAFYKCVNLESITLPASVTEIGKGALDATGLRNINLDSNNQYYSINNGALLNKAQDTLIKVPMNTSGSYIIMDSVKIIESGAFYSCNDITSVVIPENVSKIDNYAFHGMTNLEVIYVKGKSKAPAGWEEYWNYINDADVVWNYQG